MRTGTQRRWVAGVVVTGAFVATAALLLRIMPAPHSERDYLIAGTCAALIALVVLFAVLGGLGALRSRR